MGQVVEAELKLISGDAVKEIEALKKELEEVKDSFQKLQEDSKKTEKGLSKFGKVLGNIGKAGGIIFLLEKAFEGLKAAINSNQQVADAFNLVMGTIGQVFSEIANVLVSVVTNLTSTTENFDALGRVVSNVFKIAIAPFKLAIDGLALGFYNAQLAWEQSFLGSGDTEKIEALNSKIDETKQSLVDTVVGVGEAGSAIATDFGEAVSEVTKVGSELVGGLSEISVKSIAENVKANEQLKKSAELARVANQGLIEEFDRLAEQQRQIRDDDRKGINERIEANEKLLEHLENQKEKMLENANAILAQAQAQFDLSGKDEDNIRLQEAKNELKAVEAQIEGFMSEQKSNAVALEKELNELEISGLQNKAELQKVERDFKAEMIENDVLRLEQMKKNLKEEEELETKRLQNKINSFQEGTQAQQDAQQELDLFLKESGNNQKKIDKDLALAKENQTKETLGNIATIVGQNSKFGKAIAVVQAIQDTFAGANKALAQGGIFGFIGAAAVIAAGIANVKNITASKTPNPPPGLNAPPSGDIPAPAISSPATSSLPPSFNTVGASGTNQLAELLGNQPPPRAFVVSGDVSTAQELDRNIVTSASLG